MLSSRTDRSFGMTISAIKKGTSNTSNTFQPTSNTFKDLTGPPGKRASATPYPHRTLDLEHVSVMKKIEREHERAVSLRSEVAGLEERIAELEAKPKHEMTDADFDELKLCIRNLDVLETHQEEAEDEGDGINYFVQTAGVLFKYYDVLEKGGPIATGAMNAVGAPPPTSKSGDPSRSILSYFMQPKKESVLPTVPESNDSNAGSANGGSKESSVKESSAQEPTQEPSSKNTLDRASLYEMYMRSVNSGFTHQQSMKQTDKLSNGSHGSHGPCTHCGHPDRIVQLQDGYVFCNKCRTVEYILVDHEKPSYKDPPRDTSYFAYKRGNHFSEWLNQVQAKESTEIPETVFDAILLEIKKEKVTNMATLTKQKIKSILKRLKINKYYEHTTLIITRINGIPPPNFPPELEDKLRQMFCQIQAPFLKHAPAKRKNFLSYSYCLRKMVQLLDQDQYMESFSFLKARDKLQVQDEIWKKICLELSWEFIPSL